MVSPPERRPPNPPGATRQRTQNDTNQPEYNLALETGARSMASAISSVNGANNTTL